MYKLIIPFFRQANVLAYISKLCLIWLLFPSLGVAKEISYERVEIYYVRWNVLTREKLSLDDVRRRAYISTKIVEAEELAAFANWLKIDKMRHLNSDHPMTEDPRLVIDFFDKQGKKTTFFSGGFHLLSEDGLNWRPIDNRFKKKFTFFQKGL
jgi:hypothetical protein